MNNPLVSIITINYNKDKFLPLMLKSIESQVYNNIEHIVIDDGSTDNSIKILKNYDERNSYSIIKLNEENCACVAKLRNKAVEISSGEYIMNVDSDDILYSDAIEYLISNAQKRNLDLVYGSMIYIDEYGSPIKQNKISGDKYEYGYLIKKMFIPFPRMYKRDIFNLTSGYNEKYSIADDWDLYLQLEEKTNKIGWTGKRPLFAYRIIKSSLSNSVNKKIFNAEKIYIQKSALLRRKALHILLISNKLNDSEYKKLALEGNNVSSYLLHGIQNINLNQYIFGTPYKNKYIYKFLLISEITKIIKLKKMSCFDKIVIKHKTSFYLKIFIFFFFPTIIVNKIFNNH